MLDLDHFKNINDTSGHAAGDKLLQEIANRLKNCVESCDIIGRLGGDEFVVLLGQINRDEDAARVAERANIRSKKKTGAVHVCYRQ